MASDTKRREPGCECHLEEGDSPCIVHGLYEADRDLAMLKDAHTGAPFMLSVREMREALAAQGLHVVTAAEKAVLDAAKVIPEEYLRRKRRSFEYIEAFDHRHARTDVVKNELSDFCDAELARREANKCV